MKKQFIIYPHCYYSFGENNFFIYNPDNHKHIILNCFSKTRVENIDGSSVFIYSNDDSFEKFVFQCEKEGFGYSLPLEKTPIVMRRYDFKTIASLQKIKKALGYADGLKISNYIRKINIHIPVSQITLSELECEQLDYPHEQSFNYCLNQIPSYSFSCLETIYITGDFSEAITESIIRLFHDKEFVLRLVAIDDQTVFNVAAYCKKMHIKALIYLLPHYKYNLDIFNKFIDVLTICPIIYNAQDVSRYLKLKYSVLFTPIIDSKERSLDLINELLITDEDILGMTNSLEELYKKERVNPNFFGSVSIRCTGAVYSANSYIGNITENWIQSYTNWIYQGNIPWFFTRNKKTECSGCHFQALCPPISIYEQLGLLPCICKNKFV